MKVSEESWLDDEDDGGTTYYRLHIVMDDGTRLEFRDMCQEPEDNSYRDMCQCAEDNSYYRDHSDVPQLLEYLKTAYDAGRRGETLEIEML